MADLRELLILVLALLILFSVLRAVFVIVRRRKGQIRLSIDKNISQSMELEEPQEEEFDELPNGGARVVPQNQADLADAGQAPEKQALAKEEHVPVLTDAVRLAPAQADSGNAAWKEADSSRQVQPSRPKPEPAQPRKQKQNWKAEIYAAHGGESPERIEVGDGLDLGAVSMTAGERIGEPPAPSARASSRPATMAAGVDRFEAEATAEATTAPPEAEPVELEPRSKTETNIGREAKPEPQAPDNSRNDDADISPEQIIAIYAIASEDQPFAGLELWNYLLAANLRYDDMKIFSKFEGNRDDTDPVFRVANLVNPGTFDADRINEFTTPGISMFMLLPSPIDGMRAFEQMLATARGIARTFNGRLLDSRKQDLTSQSIEQARRRIREFELSAYGPSSVNSRI